MSSNKANNNVHESNSFETPTENNTDNNSDNNNNTGRRPIFTLTMDPNALEHEIDQAAHALQSTMGSLFNTVQSSVFGTLQKERASFEKSTKEFMEQHPFFSFHDHFQNFPWGFKSDGPKKRYRITIEELPPLEDEKSSKVFSTEIGSLNKKSDAEDITITQGKVGTPDEGKTVITASVAPGLLDWFLFTTLGDDPFFKRSQSEANNVKIQELSEAEQTSREEQEAARQRVVPALVEKVKQVGTVWGKDAKQWWQGDREEFNPTRQTEEVVEQESRGWPRGRSWGRSESYSETTVTRPDGTIEHRAVNTINGETETVIKVKHPDGSIEETITVENNGKYPRHWGLRSQSDEGTAEEQKGTEKSSNWLPKSWLRRDD